MLRSLEAAMTKLKWTVLDSSRNDFAYFRPVSTAVHVSPSVVGVPAHRALVVR